MVVVVGQVVVVLKQWRWWTGLVVVVEQVVVVSVVLPTLLSLHSLATVILVRVLVSIDLPANRHLV